MRARRKRKASRLKVWTTSSVIALVGIGCLQLGFSLNELTHQKLQAKAVQMNPVQGVHYWVTDIRHGTNRIGWRVDYVDGMSCMLSTNQSTVDGCVYRPGFDVANQHTAMGDIADLSWDIQDR